MPCLPAAKLKPASRACRLRRSVCLRMCVSLENALALATARLGKVDDAISMLEPDAPLDTPLIQTDTTLLYLDTGPGFARVGADKVSTASILDGDSGFGGQVW